MPFTPEGRPLRTPLLTHSHMMVQGLNRRFRGGGNLNAKRLRRATKCALKTRYCRIGLRRFWAPRGPTLEFQRVVRAASASSCVVVRVVFVADALNWMPNTEPTQNTTIGYGMKL